MTSNSRLCKIKDFVDLISEKISTAGLSVEDYISTENMLSDLGGVQAADRLPDVPRVNKYETGDTLFSNIRTYFRKVWLANKDGGVSADVLVFRTKDKSVLLPEFLYYVLSNMDFINYTVRTSKGVKMPRGDKAMIMEYEFELPELPVQAQICKILSSLDKQVFNNTAMNQTLEKIAQRIFKSWFIDFDPVKANAEGVPFNGLSPEIQALFPSEFEESELGMIPKGWKILCTQDLFEVKDGTHDSPKKAEEGNYLVTSKHITNGKIDTSSAYLIGHADFEKINQRSKVDTFDILLTMIGTVGEIVVVHDNPVEFAIKNIGLFKTSQKPELVWLFYWYLQSSMMKNYLKVRMAGTTQQYLTLKTLRTIPIIVPSSDILNNFNNLVSPLMKKIASNHKQNDVLSAIQETLLPRLISGRLLLSDVNQELKETA